MFEPLARRRSAPTSLLRAVEVSPRSAARLGSYFRLDHLTRPAWVLLRAVQSAAGRSRAPVLVGGAVRDAWLRGRSPMRPTDLDVAVQSGALDIARRVAARLGGVFVALDPERGAARVLAPGGCLDVTDWRAAALEGGLAARDFTPNALAGPVGGVFRRGRGPGPGPAPGGGDLP